MRWALGSVANQHIPHRNCQTAIWFLSLWNPANQEHSRWKGGRLMRKSWQLGCLGIELLLDLISIVHFKKCSAGTSVLASFLSPGGCCLASTSGSLLKKQVSDTFKSEVVPLSPLLCWVVSKRFIHIPSVVSWSVINSRKHSLSSCIYTVTQTKTAHLAFEKTNFKTNITNRLFFSPCLFIRHSRKQMHDKHNTLLFANQLLSLSQRH